MPKTRVGGLDLAYETHGNPDGVPILLIMGLGAQLIFWDEEFLRLLVARGHYVIRFDNRDVGESTHLSHLPTISPMQAFMSVAAGQPIAAPYSLGDMAADALGLLDALGIGSVHVVGLSMGGMIAQVMALAAPARVRSLTSIMSTTNDRSLPPPDPAAVHALVTLLSSKGGMSSLPQALAALEVLAGPAYPLDKKRAEERLRRSVERGYSEAGVARQCLAVLTAEGRGEALRALCVPTLVIHGDADPLLPPLAGQATAEAIPSARLWTVPGMGHEMPPALFQPLAAAICDHAASAESGRQR